MAFKIINRPGHVKVQFDGDEVLELVNEHCLFRSFRINNLRTRPHGPVECISLATSCFYGSYFLRAKIEAVQTTPHEVKITLTPEKVDHDLDKIVHETRIITLRYLPETDRFRYDIQVRAVFQQAVPSGMPYLAITPMPQWGGDDFAVVEFDDPLLAGGVGPQVPMTQDWQGLMEPWFDENCFTERWRKRYTHAILHTTDRGWRKIALHKTVNSAQQFYNRHLLRCVPQDPYYYLKTDGGYLCISHLYKQPSAHHICEWGMDVHCYALFGKQGEKCLFSAGQIIELDYRIEELSGAEVPASIASAPAADLEPKERVEADAPIYEEPHCRFTESTLVHPDGQAWRLEGSGSWRREGGHRSDEGALVLDHGGQRGESKWFFRFFGPSHAGNPIPPGSRHRLSAWVKASHPEDVSLELKLTNFNGPAMFSSRSVKAVKVTSEHIVRREGEWCYLECVTDPCDSYVLCGEIQFSYRGAGQASLCELSVIRI